jgi:metal-dependent HD superfamily phosphatase/phosphodiesterase
VITFEDVKQNNEIQSLINAAQEQVEAMGYTEHSNRHINIVANRCGEILQSLGYDEHTVELGKIAGYLHDIGNAINRHDHAHSGAILAYQVLKEMGMPAEDRAKILMAIGNHDEETGTAVSNISAALILADKSDVHRSRVTNTNMATFDIHDRVNYAVTDAKLEVNSTERKITLKLKIDTEICPVLNYFQIFMNRTMMSKYAAKFLNIWFELVINDTKLL